MQNGGKSHSNSSEMNSPVSVAAAAVDTVVAAGVGPSKKLKLDRDHPNVNLKKTELGGILNQHWSTRAAYSGEQATLSEDPFMHVEIKDFIAEETFLKELVLKLEGVELVEKSSDLFKFRQSRDLVSVSLPEIQMLREFFETKVLDFIKHVTGYPLDGKVDMFISKYIKTDFLLCHDDELESRRIAFIFYLSEDWDSSYGGALDLFSSSEDIHPLSIVKSIIPAFNKFVFFNVTSKSFHQVAEVTRQGVRRLAVSGWFYGDPLPRPNVTFPSTEYRLLEANLSSTNLKLGDNVAEEYLNSLNYSAINASLEEYSVAKLKLLIRPEKYKRLVGLVEDLELEWEERGPANLCSYHALKYQILPITTDGDGTPMPAVAVIEGLTGIFCSKSWYEFLEKVTEFDILRSTTQVSASLRKFQHKSYILLKTTEQKEGQDPLPALADDSSEGETWEIAPDEDDPENDGSEGTLDAENPATLSASATVAEEEAEEIENSEEEDGEGLEREIDIIYYFGDFIWDETFGGQTVYADATGQQLLTVTPEPNTMAIVVREKGIVPYVSYVNCLAGNERFYTFTLILTGFKD